MVRPLGLRNPEDGWAAAGTVPPSASHRRPGPRRRVPQAPGGRRSRRRAVGLPQHVRQSVVRGLGREAPTALITNDRATTTKTLIGRYAPRMRSSTSPRRSAASMSTPPPRRSLNVDLDGNLSVLASSVCGSLRRHLRLSARLRRQSPKDRGESWSLAGHP